MRQPRHALIPHIALGALGALGALAALATVSPAASAAPRTTTTFTSATITVSVRGARAVITRRPFRLRIEQPDGRPALAEVANQRPAPLRVAPTEDPIAPGLDNPSTTTLYAPLSFLVGTETIEQYPGGLFGGNLQSGTRQGVLYSARNVLGARRAGGGVTLTLSTSDPSGRRLIFTVAPRTGATISVTATPRPATGVVEIGDSFESSAGEGFFGFGGRHNGLNQRGQTLTSWVSEENLHEPKASAQLYPNGATAAYYPVPELFSSRSYGFLLAQAQLARFKLDLGNRRAWNVTATARALHYVVAPGAAPVAIAALTALTGRQPVPARWALGPMLDRLIKNVGETQVDYEANVRADLVNIARYRLPLTAYRLEGWGFPGAVADPSAPAANDGLSLHTYISSPLQAQVFRTLRRRGIHPLVYLRPWITPGSIPVTRGWVARTASGQPYYTTTTTGVRIALLDFTNPAAVRFWQREVARALNLGADGFMQDFGEEVLLDMRFSDGEAGATMHNRYPVLYARATREELTRYERSHPGRTAFFFTRAGYTGSAAYENANFPGDETTDWSHSSGIRSLTSDMLSRAVVGAYGYGTDIGGYYDLTTPPTTRELFLRWAEWAALTPVFRLHGSGLAGTHTPWSFGPATVRTYKALSRLHLRAAPLIMRLWRQADRTGIPVTRPLWLQFPGDRTGWRQDQEWMLGPDVLVAPVVIQGAGSRSVYFPAGCWRTSHGATVRGPRSARVSAPLTVLPYFTRCGTRPF